MFEMTVSMMMHDGGKIQEFTKLQKSFAQSSLNLVVKVFVMDILERHMVAD